LVEQRIRNAKVGGSTPLSGTNSFASSTIALGVSVFKHRLLVAIAAALFSCAALAQDKVVYHFGEGLAQATNGLRNIRNHLEVVPEVTYTPSGVQRITQLQSREGYAYLKP
jgi:hypothetical protein